MIKMNYIWIGISGNKYHSKWSRKILQKNKRNHIEEIDLTLYCQWMILMRIELLKNWIKIHTRD
jgi:hypothetical protein